jgi:hypothetical protein
VAWKNPFFGPVVFDGKLFEETKAYLTAKDKLIGVVSPKHRTGGNRVLHTNAVQQMAKQRLTYEEALASPAFSLLDRQRLRETQREINDQLLGIFGHVQPIPTASARQIGRL